jgi:RecB family endonuclease NucS
VQIPSFCIVLKKLNLAAAGPSLHSSLLYGNASPVRLSEFNLEKELQQLIEANIEVIFNCKFVASQYSSDNILSGRIDTLAISEDQNPLIIEYKKVASSDLINQSLHYLHWLRDHKGEFEIVANRTNQW